MLYEENYNHLPRYLKQFTPSGFAHMRFSFYNTIKFTVQVKVQVLHKFSLSIGLNLSACLDIGLNFGLDLGISLSFGPSR